MGFYGISTPFFWQIYTKILKQVLVMTKNVRAHPSLFHHEWKGVVSTFTSLIKVRVLLNMSICTSTWVKDVCTFAVSVEKQLLLRGVEIDMFTTHFYFSLYLPNHLHLSMSHSLPHYLALALALDLDLCLFFTHTHTYPTLVMLTGIGWAYFVESATHTHSLALQPSWTGVY